MVGRKPSGADPAELAGETAKRSRAPAGERALRLALGGPWLPTADNAISRIKCGLEGRPLSEL